MSSIQAFHLVDGRKGFYDPRWDLTEPRGRVYLTDIDGKPVKQEIFDDLKERLL